MDSVGKRKDRAFADVACESCVDVVERSLGEVAKVCLSDDVSIVRETVAVWKRLFYGRNR